jgi:hypothetical protein
LAVLLDFAIENERKGYGGGQHQQGGIHRRSDAERPWPSHSLLEVLNVRTDWTNDEHSSNIDSAHDSMQLGEPLAKSI